MTEKRDFPRWEQLLREAVEKPGVISEAYRAFHNYSSANQMLALYECYSRNIPVGPIATYRAWQDKGRQVRKGERAISLWMPVTIKNKVTDEEGKEVEETKMVFVYRPNWFVVGQTEGHDAQPLPLPEWNPDQAVRNLQVERVEFASLNGNSQGYAEAGRRVAINPLAVNPTHTLIHELAHILLGHTSDDVHPSKKDQDGEVPTVKNEIEMEAEATALIVLESLGLPGVDEARGYIQHYFRKPIGEKSAKRIFGAADKILKAGEIAAPANTDRKGRR
ncbi:MAG: ArdC-like ssDNA-binding domain-containing protein [Chloroflexi bacterium]|nr:ArdC-like ssDNA-binding domain-containing protein [Chloroflexota bacterium]